MPSEWDGFLEGLARDCAGELREVYDEQLWHVNLRVLRAELLPLLEAGDRMYENCPIDALACAWKAAKTQATGIPINNAARIAALKSTGKAK